MMSNVIPDGLDVRSAVANPLPVQSVSVTQENLAQIHEWIEINGHHAVLGNDQLIIQTLEGPFVCRIGDIVVRDIRGAFRRWDPDVYAASYKDEGPAEAGV